MVVGGIGVLSSFHYEGTSRTVILIDQISRNTSCVKVFMTYIEDMALESGIYGPLWKIDIGMNSKWVSYHSLIFAACQDNYDNKIEINVMHSTLESKRQGYQSIMHVTSNHYSLNAELSSINRVRSFHETVYISDICEADGKTLNPIFMPSTNCGFKSNTF